MLLVFKESLSIILYDSQSQKQIQKSMGGRQSQVQAQFHHSGL